MNALLKISDLGVSFGAGDDQLHAVVDAALEVGTAQRVGVIGESGSGKSVMARAVMQLDSARTTHYSTQSRIELDGKDILALSEGELAKLRGNLVSMVFQNPMHSLNPSFSIGAQMRSVLQTHRKLSRSASDQVIEQALKDVDLPGARELVHRYPHELSGGQRQRVMIAMAVLCEPKLVIADEPTSALDVTAQDTVLDVLSRLSKDKNIAILMITHDMGVVARFCERVNVMYGGRIVEQADVKSLFAAPAHPYTAALLAATPDPSKPDQEFHAIPGTQQTRKGSTPSGCPFMDRCEHAKSDCAKTPELKEIALGHKSACHFAGQLDLSHSTSRGDG